MDTSSPGSLGEDVDDVGDGAGGEADCDPWELWAFPLSGLPGTWRSLWLAQSQAERFGVEGAKRRHRLEHRLFMWCEQSQEEGMRREEVR